VRVMEVNESPAPPYDPRSGDIEEAMMHQPPGRTAK
jgi:hypothetical protein